MKYKIEKDIPVIKKNNASKGMERQSIKDRYGFIFKLKDGDSLICNRKQMGNFTRFCKSNDIGIKSRWVDERNWYECGYADDGKYRVWFYPNKLKKKEYTYENKLDYSDGQIKQLRKQEKVDVAEFMIKTIINKYWSILPKEVQEEIKDKFYKNNGGKNNDIR